MGHMLFTASVNALVSFKNFSAADSRTAKLRWKSSNSGSVDSGDQGRHASASHDIMCHAQRR